MPQSTGSSYVDSYLGYMALNNDKIKSRQSNSLAQERLQEEQRQFNILEEDRKRAADLKEQEDARQKRSNALAAQAYKANLPESLAKAKMTDEQVVATRLKAAGVALMETNPEQALKLIQQSSEIVGKTKKDEVDQIELKQKQLSYKAEVAASVVDHNTAMIATNELSQLGEQVPERYQTWGPESQAWWARRGQQAKTHLESLKVENSTNKLLIEQQNSLIKQQAQAEKERANRQSEVFNQNKLNSSNDYRDREQFSSGSTKYAPAVEKRISASGKSMIKVGDHWEYE